jgi:tetratricopeptide (TPR) repeat protein
MLRGRAFPLRCKEGVLIRPAGPPASVLVFSSSARTAHIARAAPVDALQLLAPRAVMALDPVPAAALFDVAEGLETPIQLLYLVTLLSFLAAAAFLVVRQALIRRELDESAKGLGERIRTGEATCEDYFELGVVLTRKRLFTQATKNLEKAKKVWDGEESELAQVHNALGYCYLNMEQVDASVTEFKRAVQLQPGYVTAWNNLGDAYERTKSWRNALSAYQEALSYAPANDIARQRT